MKSEEIYKEQPQIKTTIGKAARALALKGPKSPFLVTVLIKKTINAVDELQAKEIIESDITEYSALEDINIENTRIKEIIELT